LVRGCVRTSCASLASGLLRAGRSQVANGFDLFGVAVYGKRSTSLSFCELGPDFGFNL
jgi:hypothetical protein